MRKERTNLELRKIKRNDGQLEWLPRNPRQWTQTDIDNTARSIAEDEDFLEDRPLLVTPYGDEFVVFAGNLRREGAKKQKMKTVPAVVYYPETDEDALTVKRRAMKDNGSFGAWDYDALANEWDDLPLQDWGVPAWETEDKPATPEVKEDDFNEDAEVETRCNPGDIWRLGEHRLMCGDSTDGDKVALLMNGETADLLLTDPPYGTTALEWDVKIDLQKVFKSIKDACKKDAVVLITGAQPFVTDIINAGRDLFRYEIIWKKTQSSGFLQANNAPLRIHENIIVFGKSSGTYNPIKKKIGEGTGRVRHQKANRAKHYHGNNESIYIDDGTRYPTDVVEFSNWNGALFGDTSKEVVHPTQKPVELFSYLIQTYTDEENKVLDLFGGSGTTLIAAEQLNRKCYMMELDPHYCDVIISRWEQFTGKTAQLITSGDKVS